MNGEQSIVNGSVVKQRSVFGWLLTVHACLLASVSPLWAAQIQDNSFLIEEAYNQERGIVQHISTFQREDGGDWAYGFTQEWPLGGIRHQLSYTIPFERAEAFGTGVGDVALNYRYQLAGNPDARTVMAPRASLILPTGDEAEGRGSGGVGFQANLPVTLVHGNQLVTHWNAGAILTPSARNELDDEASITDFNVGASLIWLARPFLNVLVEAVWLSEQSVVGDGQTVRQETTVLSPGIRAALDVPGGLQIVPGIAYTIGLSPDAAEDALFVYLSFEHPFKRQ